MRLLKDFLTYTANGNVAPGFSLQNLAKIDTNLVWRGIYTSEQLSFNLGAPMALDSVFINNTNFTSLKISLSNNSSFTDTIIVEAELKPDDLGIVRGFVTVPSGSYQHIKLECSDIISGSAIQIGNVIIGKSLEIYTASLDSEIVKNIVEFNADGGAYRQRVKGQARHNISLNYIGKKDTINGFPLVFSSAVIFADLGAIEESYIIGPAQNIRKTINNNLDCSISLAFSELV